MTRATESKMIRRHFGKERGRILDAMPLEEGVCAVCHTKMFLSDGQIKKMHGCCRPFRNNEYGAQSHIEECHGNTR